MTWNVYETHKHCQVALSVGRLFHISSRCFRICGICRQSRCCRYERNMIKYEIVCTAYSVPANSCKLRTSFMCVLRRQYTCKSQRTKSTPDHSGGKFIYCLITSLILSISRLHSTNLYLLQSHAQLCSHLWILNFISINTLLSIDLMYMSVFPHYADWCFNALHIS